jgi:hypothetical protein
MDNNRIQKYLPYFFFPLAFLYVWLWIKPCLYLQRSESTFIIDSNYFNQFVQYPGGLTAFIGSFLRQFYYHSWMGALIIVLTLIFMYFILYRIIRRLNKYAVNLIYLPLILVLILHTEYDHAITTNMGILFSLSFFYLYLRTSRKKIWINIVCFLFSTLILYYLAAGWVFLFVLLVVIFEILFNKQLILVSIYGITALIIPYFAASHLWIIPFKKSYLFLLPVSTAYYISWYPYAVLFIFPLIVIITGLLYRLHSNHKAVQFFKNVKSSYMLYAASGVLLIFLLFLSTRNQGRIILLFDYHAAKHHWDDIIKLADVHHPEHIIQIVQINRSLYHKHELLNKMFSYPQNWGSEGLVPSIEFCYSYPMLRSDLFFELGHFNESQHWALEELSPYGDSPRNLKRLAQINIIKKNPALVRSFLSILDKTFFYRGESRIYRSYLTDAQLLSQDPYLSKALHMIVEDDFIISSSNPFADLEELVKKDSKNRMAFEYLIAYSLLSFRLNKLIKHLYLLDNFQYADLPAHVEEGILTYMYTSGNMRVDLGNFHIKPRTLQRFRQFVTILNRHKGDVESARQALQQKFSDTYWYYSTFKNPLVNTEG